MSAQNKCEGYDVIYNPEAIGVPDKDLTIRRFLFIPHENCCCESNRKKFRRAMNIDKLMEVLVLIGAIFASAFFFAISMYYWAQVLDRFK